MSAENGNVLVDDSPKHDFTITLCTDLIIKISQYLNKQESLLLGMVNQVLHKISQTAAYLIDRDSNEVFTITPELLLASTQKNANTFAYTMMKQIHFICVKPNETKKSIDMPFKVSNRDFITKVINSSNLESIHFQNMDILKQIPLSAIFANRTKLDTLIISNYNLITISIWSILRIS